MTTSYTATTLNMIMIVLCYIGPSSSHKSDIVQCCTHNNETFLGSQPAVDVTEQFSAKKTIFENVDQRGCFR